MKQPVAEKLAGSGRGQQLLLSGGHSVERVPCKPLHEFSRITMHANQKRSLPIVQLTLKTPETGEENTFIADRISLDAARGACRAAKVTHPIRGFVAR